MSRNKKNSFSGAIDLEDFTTTAYLPVDGNTLQSVKFGENGKSFLQVGSDNLSGAVTCTLQISIDGNYWATAQEAGTDVTFSLDTDAPIVQIIEGADGLLWRLAITIGGNTGIIKYFIGRG